MDEIELQSGFHYTDLMTGQISAVRYDLASLSRLQNVFNQQRLCWLKTLIIYNHSYIKIYGFYFTIIFVTWTKGLVAELYK